MAMEYDFGVENAERAIRGNTFSVNDMLNVMLSAIKADSKKKEVKENLDISNLEFLTTSYKAKLAEYSQLATAFSICAKTVNVYTRQLEDLKASKHPDKQNIAICEGKLKQATEEYNAVKERYLQSAHALETIFNTFCHIEHRATLAAKVKARIADALSIAKKELPKHNPLFKPIGLNHTIKQATDVVTSFANDVATKTRELCDKKDADALLGLADECQISAIEQLNEIKRLYEVAYNDGVFDGDFKTLKSATENFYEIIDNVNSVGDQAAHQIVSMTIGGETSTPFANPNGRRRNNR